MSFEDGGDDDVNPVNDGDRLIEGDHGQSQNVAFEDDSVQGFFSHKDSVYAIAAVKMQYEASNIKKEEILVLSGGGDDMAYFWNGFTGEPCLSHRTAINTYPCSCTYTLCLLVCVILQTSSRIQCLRWLLLMVDATLLLVLSLAKSVFGIVRMALFCILLRDPLIYQ